MRKQRDYWNYDVNRAPEGKRVAKKGITKIFILDDFSETYVSSKEQRRSKIWLMIRRNVLLIK